MRLTKKDDLFLGGYEPMCDFSDAFSKLGKLEDIEDKFGIDLLVLAKAMMDGIYDIKGRRKYPTSFLRFSDFFFQIKDKDGNYGILRLYKDYGKTWALTRKELL